MKKSLLIVVFLVVASLVAVEVEKDTDPAVAGFFSRVWGAIGDDYQYYRNYFGHSTSTTKLHAAIAAARQTFCTAKGFTPSTCAALRISLASKYPAVQDDNVFNRAQNHNKEVAYIRSSANLCQQEEDFRAGRLAHVARALKKVFGESAGDLGDHVPTIAVCASGGGWRAMLATGGFYEGLAQPIKEDNQVSVLDTIMYASCLSGSSWFTMPRALGIPTEALKAGYLKYGLIPVDLSPSNINNLKKNKLVMPQKDIHPATFEQDGITYENNFFNEQETLSNAIMRYFLFNIPLSAVTLYGHMIAHIALSPADDPAIYNKYVNGVFPKQARQELLISQAADYLERNNYSNFPLAIGTMVSPITVSKARQQKTSSAPYIWAEVTPYETGFDYYANNKLIGAYVPTWATGRRFTQLSEDGEQQWWLAFWKRNENTQYGSTNFAPEPSLGSFLGIFGSAFTFSMEDLARMFFNFDVNAGGIKGMAAKVVDIVGSIPPVTPLSLALYLATPGKNTRVFPAELPNYGVTPDSPFYGQDLWTVADAGLAGNLPFWPLLKEGRHVDIIIALDAGADVVKGGSALAQAESLAKERRVPFPKITASSKYANRNKQRVTVFDEYDYGQQGPIVIYCALVGEWIEQCLKGECTTFNFKYSKESAEGVWNLAKDISQAMYPELQKAVQKSVAGKTKPIRMSYMKRTFKKLKNTVLSYLGGHNLV